MVEAELMNKSAILSPCQQYRYLLQRWWGPGPRVLWIMLNPSTADHEKDDPTIRKCIGFTREWGFDGLEVVNMYAFRTAYPKELAQANRLTRDIVGVDNDWSITEAAQRTALHVAAWGASPIVHWYETTTATREQRVVTLLRQHGQIYCIQRTNKGYPPHPLYQPYTKRPSLWDDVGAERIPERLAT